MGVTVELGSGKKVKLVDEYGPDQTLRAAELSEAPARMSYAQSMLLNIASVMVAVVDVDGKGIDAITGDAVKAKDLLMAFRKHFTEAEWDQLDTAIAEVFPADPKLKKGKAYKILSS